MRILIAGAALLFAAAPAKADELKAYGCHDALSQSDLNICADKDYRAADAALNTAYRKAMDGLDENGRAPLKTAQRAWLTFRDAECKYEAAPNEGGSIYPMIYSLCLARLTKARTAQLKDGQQ
jgi:uncharacterized protein YecT (DUF1311 family)